MAVQLIVTLPEHVYERAQRLAELTGRDVADVVTNSLGWVFSPLDDVMDTTPVESLADQAVLGLADSQMDITQSSRMSELLQKQQASLISDPEHAELETLMAIYDLGQQRKTEALVEAVKRGLRAPLSS